MFERSWRWLAQPRVLLVLIIVLLAVLVLGTLLPQLPQVAPGGAQLAGWRALAQARYGPLFPLLEVVGAYRLYRTPLLWAPIVLLALATLACIIRRWHAFVRAAFNQPVRLPETVLASASHTCMVKIAPGNDSAGLDALSGIVERTLRRRDYRLRTEKDAGAAWLRGDRNRLSPLAALVEHLAVLVILVGVGLSLLFGWREALVIEPDGKVEVGHATGITLSNVAFEIERYEDGSPAAYAAQVTIESGRGTERRTIGVNQPVVLRAATLYLQGYRAAEGRYAVTLLAVRDPGYGVVVAGGILFLLGVVVALYCPRSTVHVRITEDGMLRLTGWADHRAYDYGREFAELCSEFRREMGEAQDSTPLSAEQKN